MKRKTNFEQMYLVDDTLHNKINNVPSNLPQTIIVGKEKPSQTPEFNHTPSKFSSIKKEIGSKVTETTPELQHAQSKTMKSSGMVTEDIPPTVVQLSQQNQIDALQEQLQNSQHRVHSLETSIRTPQVVDQSTQYHDLPAYTSRSKNRSLRNVNRTLQSEYRTPLMEDRTPQLEFRNPQPDYNALQMQYPNMIQNIPLSPLPHQVNAQQLAIPQASGPLTSYSHPMDTSPAPLPHQVHAQQLAIPQPSGPLTSYSYPMFTSPAPPEQLELMDFNTYKPIEYQTQVPTRALLSQPMDSSETVLAHPPPVAITQTPTRALPPPIEDECEDCTEDSTVTKYVKYNEPGIVALPSARGLPNNVLFTCTLCNTNFKTQKALERHVKNLHEAFSQKETGAKRKLVVTNTRMNKKSKGDKNLRNKSVVSYKKYL